MRANLERKNNDLRKRSQIGALSAATSKLTPSQIELKISHKKDKANPIDEVISKEFQVIQSKQGMIADISRTLSEALTYKSDFFKQ